MSVCVWEKKKHVSTAYRRLRVKRATDQLKVVLLIRCMRAMKGYRESESERNFKDQKEA